MNKLEVLRPNHAGAFILKDGSTENYGVIRIDRDCLVYFTSKELREIWSPKLEGKDKIKAAQLKDIPEEEKIKLKLVAIIPLNVIVTTCPHN